MTKNRLRKKVKNTHNDLGLGTLILPIIEQIKCSIGTVQST
jgi:hypothetical protein